jgi:hypothetical protein
MALKTEPLLADYAVVAGARIVENAAASPKLPEKVQQRYLAWREANEKLTASRRQFRGDIRVLDGALDRAVGVPAHIIQAILDGYSDTVAPLDDEQRQRFDDALAIHAVFGSDLRTITALPYPQEWASIRDVLHALQQGELAPAVQRLGLAPDVRRIASLHALYGERLGITGPGGASDEAQAIAAWNHAMHALLVSVAFFEDEHPELKPTFEAPYLQQLAAQRKAAADDRKRSAQRKADEGH